ncbi:hypothetical protein GF322_00185 [Candidatus Dependentiae bacterium]|nr:hypothetical protein [Candidatus Dependentiae bacterium]
MANEILSDPNKRNEYNVFLKKFFGFEYKPDYNIPAEKEAFFK